MNTTMPLSRICTILQLLKQITIFSKIFLGLLKALINILHLHLSQELANFHRLFAEHIQAVVESRNHQKENSSTTESILEEMRIWYNGYRFSREKTWVYNPFSTISYLKELKKHRHSMVSLDGTTAKQEQLMDISSFNGINLPALMDQMGYFTIKGYNPLSQNYSIGFPNEEVRSLLCSIFLR